MKNRKILEQAFKEVFNDDWGNELRDFEHAFSDFFDATMKAIEIAKSERQTSTEVSEQHDSKALHIADVMHRFSPNDVDGAYLLGVFNVSGIDGLQKEIARLKELNVNPHNIMDSIKSNGA